MRVINAVVIGLASWPALVWAHTPFSEPDSSATVVAFALLVFVWLAYALGCRRRPPANAQAWLFHSACTLSVLTLFGPLDEWAETNEAAHMVQHMLMMVVIAPLWVMARPLPQWYALSARIGRLVFAPLFALAAYPMVATAIHGAIIWLWHTPSLYVLALENLWWHFFEHLCFLLTAGVFWWAVLRCQERNTGRALLALLVTLMHTGFLGALLTFSQRSWYGADRVLEHQQLAGLLMWVLGAIPYLGAAFFLGWRWFSRVMRGSESH